MAWFKDDTYLSRTTAKSAWWDKTYAPGERAEISGIFRCPGCGAEIAHQEGEVLPAGDAQHRHSAVQGEVRWRLIVRSNTNPR